MTTRKSMEIGNGVEVCCLRLPFFRRSIEMDAGGGQKSLVYRCPHCTYTNTCNKLVHAHKIMHSKPQLRCTYCGHLDHYPSRMMRHMTRRHRGLTAHYERVESALAGGGTDSSQQSTGDSADGESTIRNIYFVTYFLGPMIPSVL